MPIALVSLLVRDHDEAIDFFVKMLGFIRCQPVMTVNRNGGWLCDRPTPKPDYY
jgi:hypothetical protein